MSVSSDMYSAGCGGLFWEFGMKRFTASIGMAVVALGLGVGAYAHEGQHAESEEGKKVTLTGELVDTACFITGDAKGPDHAECATKCMASGVPAGILPEGKDSNFMMFLLTNPKVLAAHAGQTIRVEGTTYEHNHAVDVSKVEVKDGDNWKEIQLSDEHHGMGEKQHEDGHKGHDH